MPRGDQPAALAVAISAWNMMDGLDWSALELIVDLLAVVDVELLIAHLMLIKTHLQSSAE